jgi:plastocyanin
MRRFFAAGCGALIMAAVSFACGGGGYNAPTAPNNPNPGTGSAVTIEIVANRGAQSFSPNPAPQGDTRPFTWHNADGTVHRIAANDGSFDTGNIGPGGTSAMIQVGAAGTHYHCTIHPTMIGAVRGSDGDTPPCTGAYC